MYTFEDYELLSEFGRAELRQKLCDARQTLEYYQELDNQPLEFGERPVNLQVILRGIQNCEAYIIEIERRLGAFNEAVSAMLLKRKFKGIQSRGIQPSAFCQSVSEEISREVLQVGVKRFRKFNIRSVKQT